MVIRFYTGLGVTDARTLDERWQRNFEASQKRLALKERAIALLGGKCQKCGYNKCPAAFDFHHLDATEKDFDVSDRIVWSTALEAELGKCVLLCSNCHREAHAGWHPELIVQEEEGMGGGENPYWDDDDEMGPTAD